MASVQSLDKDLRQLRLSKYTPQAANEVKSWVEEVLGERMGPGDLMEGLKDGIMLCKLVNLAVGPPGIKYKQSNMPFVQMENISHFLQAIQVAPLNMPPHDTFLTVDLYESKDPLQVITCLGAFSRVAHGLNPYKFRSTIGPKGKVMSPQGTGPASENDSARPSSSYSNSGQRKTNPLNPMLTGGSNKSNSSTGHGDSVSSWSTREHQQKTAPAWNIHQYGYLGGASQGNQGISFGARRQITSAGPHVPSLAEKEAKRKAEAAEFDRQRLVMEEAEDRRRAEMAAEEARIQQAAAEEARIKRETERARIDEERRRWKEEERKWQTEKESPASEISTAAKPKPPPKPPLRGQYLSEYRAETKKEPTSTSEDGRRRQEQERIRELELELEKAREREAQYERERKERTPGPISSPTPTIQKQAPVELANISRERRDSEESWRPDEREYLPREWKRQEETPSQQRSRPTTRDEEPAEKAPVRVKTNHTGPSSRPLPDPAAYNANMNRTDKYLASNAPLVAPKPQTHIPRELSNNSESERFQEDSRREESLSKTKAGGWASKSLLEREMERERERQQEWERSQKATQDAVARGVGQGSQEGSTNQGGAWEVNQYGWLGGDSQNRANSGIGFGARRQIIGPRPPPS